MSHPFDTILTGMNNNMVSDYGWDSQSVVPESCGYIAPQIVDLVRVLKLGRVLDLGAGNGALCSMITEAGSEAVGVEYDVKGYELARSRYRDIHFYNLGVQDDPELLMSKEAVFDGVVSTEVIEHLYAPHLLPIFAAAALKQGGYLIVSTPFHGYLKNLVLSLLNKWDLHHTPLWHGGHIKFWSRQTLTRLLDDYGFDVVAFHGVGRVRYLWKSMILVARRKPATTPR